MVLGKTHQRTPIAAASLLLLIIFLMFLILLFSPKTNENSDLAVPNTDSQSSITDTVKKKSSVPLINFQPVVDEWVNSTTGEKSVLIFDIENEKLVGAYNLKQECNIASLYKLFVVYEVYRRIDSGEWNKNDMVGTTNYTIIDCADLAIRESDSSCAEALWDMIGYDELDEIFKSKYKVTESMISQFSLSSEDLLKIMVLFYLHPDIKSNDLISRMKDSFLNQPDTIYNWRQGLPSGFTKANVYDKVGWDFDADLNRWNVYHDSAIVEFPQDDRHYIVVVMTSNVSFQSIIELGKMIEDQYVLKNSDQ